MADFYVLWEKRIFDEYFQEKNVYFKQKKNAFCSLCREIEETFFTSTKNQTESSIR